MNTAVILDGVEYARYEQKILHNINLVIEEGDFIVLVGPNGSGKSTLIKTINGSVKPNRGQIIINNKNIVGLATFKIAQMVATLTQDVRHSTFSELTVEMNLDLALSRSNRAPRDKQAYVASFNPSLKNRLHTLAGQLSGGQRQSLALAMCFAHTPQVLLLDEHTSALDPKAATTLMALTNAHVCEKKLTTIMITHSLEHALQFGNRLIALKDGQIVADIKGADKAQLDKNDVIALAY